MTEYPEKSNFGEGGFIRTRSFRGDTVHCGKKAWTQECDASLPSMEQWITFHPHTGSSKTRFSIKVPPSKGSITSPKSVTNWEPSIQIREPTGELYFLDHSHTNPHQNFTPMFTADSSITHYNTNLKNNSKMNEQNSVRYPAIKKQGNRHMLKHR